MFFTDENIHEEYIVYPHQVAGHRFEDGKQGMLVDKDGKLLKPIQEPPRGVREVDFYHKVFAKDADLVTLQLRSFIPAFYGIKVVSHSNSSFKDKYIKLEDVTRHFNKPCILDVKIGQVTFDHLASEAKRERHILKYPEQELFGFRILGTKVYKKDLKQFKYHDKSVGKKLKTYQQIRESLREFFCPGSNGTEHALNILDQCKVIKTWFLKQRKFRFFASSILIVYEGDTRQTVGKDSQDMSEFSTCVKANIQDSKKLIGDTNFVHPLEDYEKCRLKVGVAKEQEFPSNVAQPSVHLIDFAHTYIDNFSEPDGNYLYGLQSFIHCLEELVS